MIWLMRIACWINKARHTHSEYAIRIAFALQKWLLERISMLRLYVHFLCYLYKTKALLIFYTKLPSRCPVMLLLNPHHKSRFIPWRPKILTRTRLGTCLYLYTHTHIHTYIHTYIYTHIYTYALFAERQIIEAYLYDMFYSLLNSYEDDHYVPSDRKLQQGIQQTWPLQSDFRRNFLPTFSLCDVVCLAWTLHPYGECSLC